MSTHPPPPGIIPGDTAPPTEIEESGRVCVSSCGPDLVSNVGDKPTQVGGSSPVLDSDVFGPLEPIPGLLEPLEPFRVIPPDVPDPPRKTFNKLGNLEKHVRDKKARIEKLKAEKARRDNCNNLAQELCFRQQLDFIKDGSRRKAVICPRRAGKTYGIAIYLMEEGLKHPGVKLLYIGLSKSSAENAIWRDCLYRIKVERGLKGLTYNKVERIVYLPGGSTIQLGGIDSSPKDRERFLGGKYWLAIIDECQSHTQDLKAAIIDVLAPAMQDYYKQGGGILVLAGFPGTHMGEHFWWLVTKQDEQGRPDPGREKGWSVHSWGVPDNPHMVEAFAETCREAFEKDGPEYASDPVFRRNHLGHWTLDLDSSVYKYKPVHNDVDERRDAGLIKSLLSGDAKWFYVLGVDLGFTDPTAYLVGAYSTDDPTFYAVECVTQAGAVLKEVAGTLLGFVNKYRIGRLVMDTASKQFVESLRAEYNLPIVAAGKQDKEGHVIRINSDFQFQRIKVVTSHCQPLLAEWAKLKVDRRAAEKGFFKEGEKYKNHAADAFLYAYRESMHMFAKPQVTVEKTFGDQIREQFRRDRLTASGRMSRRDFRDPLDAAVQHLRNESIVSRFRGSK